MIQLEQTEVGPKLSLTSLIESATVWDEQTEYCHRPWG